MTALPDSLFCVLTHLKHEELITGDSDCKIKLQKPLFFPNDVLQYTINSVLQSITLQG